MGICHPGKLNYLNQSLDSVDKYNHLFKNKILAIDQFNGNVFPQPFNKKFSAKNWNIIIDNHMSRSRSILHALEAAESEWVFYTEDDITLDLPTDFDLSNFTNDIDGRKPGLISMNFGGTRHDLGINDVGDMAFAEENTIYSNDNLICFKRIEETRDDFFFDFPCLFVRKEVFKKCLLHAMEFNKNCQIEFALSLSWFQLDMDKDYFKASILKKSFLDYRYKDAMDIHRKARFFKIIDPLQGHFAYGGNTNV